MGGRSETDSTVEVESLGGELQELPQEEGAGSPCTAFDGSLSCNSSSSSSSQLEGEQEVKGQCGGVLLDSFEHLLKICYNELKRLRIHNGNLINFKTTRQF